MSEGQRSGYANAACGRCRASTVRAPCVSAGKRSPRVDGASDNGVPDLVCVEDAPGPVRRRPTAGARCPTASSRRAVHERLLLRREGFCGLRSPRDTTASRRRSAAGRRRRARAAVADLAEPVAILVDEIEREPVRAGGSGARTSADARASRRGRPRAEPGAQPAPDECVPELVEPVVRHLAPAARPAARAGVLEVDRTVVTAGTCRPSSQPSQRTASGPAGTGCSPTVACRG